MIFFMKVKKKSKPFINFLKYYYTSKIILFLFPISGNEQKYFSIDPATGKLFAIKEINRENLDSDEFLLELEATQRDNPLKSATTRVKIQIQDVNDNRPLFKTGHFEKSILENVPNGADIVKFTAIDKDSVRSPLFDITSKQFNLAEKNLFYFHEINFLLTGRKWQIFIFIK